MDSSNNNTYKQYQKICSNLSGLSEKLNYSDKKKRRPSESPLRTSSETSLESKAEGSSRERIEIHSRSDKSFKRLFALQEEVLGNNAEIAKSIRFCRRVPSFTSREVIASEGEKKGSIKGVFCCGSAKCPACSSYVSGNHKNRLKKVIEYSSKKNLSVALLTLTFSHNLKDNFSEILQKLIEAKTYFLRMRKFRKLNIVWNISRLEFTHGLNGWHPHFHIALGLENWDPQNEDILKLEWIRVCKKFGLSSSFERGLDIIIDREFTEVENYIMKSGKSLADEIGHAGTKDGRFESVSIEYLLDIVAGLETDRRYGKERAKALLEIYYEGVKGRAIFSSSNTFEDIIKEIEEAEDQENKGEEGEDDSNPESNRPRLKIGNWVLNHLAYTKQLYYLYSFIGHNDLTRLYDDLLDILPDYLIGGLTWIDEAEEPDRLEQAA
jgi:hypothetical protein